MSLLQEYTLEYIAQHIQAKIIGNNKNNIVMLQEYTLEYIAQHIQAKIIGNNSAKIVGINTLDKANSDQIAVFYKHKIRHQLKSSRAGAIIVTAEHASNCPNNALVVAKPRLAYARVSELFKATKTNAGIHTSAVIHKTAVIEENVTIEAGVIVCEGVIIKHGTYISALSVIGANTYIEENCLIYPNVVLYSKVNLGHSTIVHSGCIIGSDGFGFERNDNQEWEKIHHSGGVKIGHNCEIGSNSTIDCGTLDPTYISNGVKIDSQVHIGHNVHIEENTIIAANTGIAGSAHIGKRCIIGGGCGIKEDITIIDDIRINAATRVDHEITELGTYCSGTWAVKSGIWKRTTAQLLKINDLVLRIKKLEKLFSNKT